MFAIVTETLSCLHEGDCDAFGVSLIPLSCVVGKHTYRDRILSSAVALPRAACYSVPPTEEAYRAKFEALLAEFDCVLCVTASRKFSDSHRNASRAAVPFGGRVTVVDSGSVAGGLLLVVLRARYLVTLGYPLSRIKAELESYKHTLRVSFTAGSAAMLQSAAKLSYQMPEGEPAPDEQPVFHIRKGGIGVTTYVRGQDQIMDEMLNVLEIDGRQRPPSHVVVHYADRTSAVEYLLSRIATLYPSATVYERPITLSLQVNLGRDIVGIIGD